MITLEESEKRLKLLKKARESLSNDLRDSHMKAFSQWQRECEEAWNKDKKLLPYLVQSFYPTEAEIVARAVELYKESLEQKTEDVAEEPEIESVDDFVKETEVVAKLKTKKDK